MYHHSGYNVQDSESISRQDTEFHANSGSYFKWRTHYFTFSNPWESMVLFATLGSINDVATPSESNIFFSLFAQMGDTQSRFL